MSEVYLSIAVWPLLSFGDASLWFLLFQILSNATNVWQISWLLKEWVSHISSLGEASGSEWLCWARCLWSAPRSLTCRSQCGSPACREVCQSTAPSTGLSACAPGPGTVRAVSPSGWSSAALGQHPLRMAVWSQKTSWVSDLQINGSAAGVFLFSCCLVAG